MYHRVALFLIFTVRCQSHVSPFWDEKCLFTSSEFLPISLITLSMNLRVLEHIIQHVQIFTWTTHLHPSCSQVVTVGGWWHLELIPYLRGIGKLCRDKPNHKNLMHLLSIAGFSLHCLKRILWTPASCSFKDKYQMWQTLEKGMMHYEVILLYMINLCSTTTLIA